MEEGADHQYLSSRVGNTSSSPAIARRRKLTRTRSSPLLSLSIGGGGSGTDLPPLVGVPLDPTRYAYHHSQEKNVSGSVSPTKTGHDSPVINRRGRQLKPQLLRQGSEPQLSQRLHDLKLIPSPPGDHGVQSPRSNGSSCCNSPRLIKRTYGRSTDGLHSSSGSLGLRTFPNPNQSLTTPVEQPPRPQSPLITSDSPFSIFHSPTNEAASNPPIPRHGVRIRRTSGHRADNSIPDAPPSSPGHESKQYSFPESGLQADDHSTRSRSTWPPPRQIGFDQDLCLDNKFICETDIQNAVDDETGEPLYVTCDSERTKLPSSDWQNARNGLQSSKPNGNLSASDYRSTGDTLINNGTSSHPSSEHASVEEAHPGHPGHTGHPGHPACVTTNPSATDMLYDIKETHGDEVVHEAAAPNNHSRGVKTEPSESEEEEEDEREEEQLPEYRKPPISTNNRVTQWLEGLQPSDDNGTITAGTLLPNI